MSYGLIRLQVQMPTLPLRDILSHSVPVDVPVPRGQGGLSEVGSQVQAWKFLA